MRKLVPLAGGALLAFGAAAAIAVSVTSAAAQTPRLPIPQTRITILSSDVPVSGGVARVRLSCQMGEAIRLTCRGVLSLHALTGALLGRTRFAIPNCCSAPWHVVGVRVGQAARSLPLRAHAQAALDGGAASSTRNVRLVGAG